MQPTFRIPVRLAWLATIWLAACTIDSGFSPPDRLPDGGRRQVIQPAVAGADGGGQAGAAGSGGTAGDAGSSSFAWPPPPPRREVPACAGQVKPCLDRLLSECTLQSGCNKNGACTGSRLTCAEQVDWAYCTFISGCTWYDDDNACRGPVLPCNDYNASDCEWEQGCSWVPNVCAGQATACNAFSVAACGDQAGCELICSSGLTVCGDTCVDLSDDEAHCGQCGAVCAPHSVCTDWTCQCRRPFSMCGDTCADLTSDSNNCNACGNVCGTGSACVDRACVDVDECGFDACKDGRSCTNTVGSFSCGPCPAGFMDDGKHGCSDVNECAVDNGGCDPLAACTNTVAGQSTCGPCPGGYSGTGSTSCIDIDECAIGTHDCDLAAGATCIDQDGSFDCDCPDGYTGDGHLASSCIPP